MEGQASDQSRRSALDYGRSNNKIPDTGMWLNKDRIGCMGLKGKMLLGGD